MHILVRRKGAVCTDDERKVKEKIKDLLEKNHGHRKNKKNLPNNKKNLPAIKKEGRKALFFLFVKNFSNVSLKSLLRLDIQLQITFYDFSIQLVTIVFYTKFIQNRSR